MQVHVTRWKSIVLISIVLALTVLGCETELQRALRTRFQEYRRNKELCKEAKSRQEPIREKIFV